MAQRSDFSSGIITTEFVISGIDGSHDQRIRHPLRDDEVRDFRSITLAALDAFAVLATQLDELLGEVLGLPELPDLCTNGPDMLAAIDYRPGVDGSEPALEGQMRMGAHTDYTSFTLLAADPVRGLQIVGPDGSWVDVVPRAGPPPPTQPRARPRSLPVGRERRSQTPASRSSP